MSEYWYLLIYISILLLCFLAWVYRWNIMHLRRHTYQDMVAEKEQLLESVRHWRYPDGTYVPQHKRQRMFKELQILSHKIRRHPDNPDNAT